MSVARRRAIAKAGNAKLRELGKVHTFTSEEAREAAKKVERKDPVDAILDSIIEIRKDLE